HPDVRVSNGPSFLSRADHSGNASPEADDPRTGRYAARGGARIPAPGSSSREERRDPPREFRSRIPFRTELPARRPGGVPRTLEESHVFDKLEAVEARYVEVEARLGDPELAGRPDEFRKLSREHASLGKVVSEYRRYKKIKDEL